MSDYTSVQRLRQFGNANLAVKSEDHDELFAVLASKYGGAVALNFTIALDIPDFLERYDYESYADYLQELIENFGEGEEVRYRKLANRMGIEDDDLPF